MCSPSFAGWLKYSKTIVNRAVSPKKSVRKKSKNQRFVRKLWCHAVAAKINLYRSLFKRSASRRASRSLSPKRRCLRTLSAKISVSSHGILLNAARLLELAAFFLKEKTEGTMFIRKFKFFLMAGIAALYISCSDDSNSLNASDAGWDDGKIADTSTPNYGTRPFWCYLWRGRSPY